MVEAPKEIGPGTAKPLRAPLDTRREGFRSAVTGEDKEKGGNLVLGDAYARFAVEQG
jgi:hypothetical protein